MAVYRGVQPEEEEVDQDGYKEVFYDPTFIQLNLASSLLKKKNFETEHRLKVKRCAYKSVFQMFMNCRYLYTGI
jgi:hypothetical protein